MNFILILDQIKSYIILVKSNSWSIINAGFWLGELLLGYKLCKGPLEGKSAGFENHNNGGWITFCRSVGRALYFLHQPAGFH